MTRLRKKKSKRGKGKKTKKKGKGPCWVERLGEMLCDRTLLCVWRDLNVSRDLFTCGMTSSWRWVEGLEDCLCVHTWRGRFWDHVALQMCNEAADLTLFIWGMTSSWRWVTNASRETRRIACAFIHDAAVCGVGSHSSRARHEACHAIKRSL